MQFLLEGVARRRVGALPGDVGDRATSSRRSSAAHGWSLAGVDICRADAGRGEPRAPTSSTPSSIPPRSSSRDDARDPRRGRAAQPVAGGVRLALRAAPAGRQPAALPAAGPGAEAVLRRPPLHGPVLDDQPAHAADLQLDSIAHGVLQLEQLDPSTAASAAGCGWSSFAACDFRGGYHDFVIRRGGLEVFPRLVAADASARVRPDAAPSGLAALDHAARRRPGARHQHPADRRGGHRQVLARGAGTPARRRARGERPRCSSSTRAARPLVTRAAGLGLGMQPSRRRGPISAPARSTRPSSRRASSPRSCAGSVEHDHTRVVVHRQPQRLPQRDARRALPHHPAARVADLSRPARRRDDPGAARSTA